MGEHECSHRGEADETRICTTANGHIVSTGKGTLLHLVSVLSDVRVTLPCVLHTEEDDRNAVSDHFSDTVSVIRVLIHHGIFLTDMRSSPDS